MAKALDFLADDGAGPSSTPSRRPTKIPRTASTVPAPSSSSALIAHSKSRRAALPRTVVRAAGNDQDALATTDDNEDDDEAAIASALHKHNVKAGVEVAKAASKLKGGKAKAKAGETIGGGSFQSMGLMPSLLKSLLIRGYTTPTPIQRAAIPSILAQPSRDLVGMARTGSGKTLSYIVPLVHKLNGSHSSSFGIKALILCPGRELALQILKVGKDICRGCKQQDAEAIRWAMIVGGESLDEQFALMASNPDVVIGTPGRLLHLAVEMNMDLSAVKYAVFDEADRLFEMGFAAQLEELLKRLPVNRQTLLFSATLPKSLVEFARAGLGANPKLVRLDGESKISDQLRMGFLSIKPADKEAALLILLRDVIGVPFGEGTPQEEEVPSWNKKRKFVGKGRSSNMPGGIKGTDHLLPHQTIIFCATKHHVEYLLALLTHVGYACSHIYSSLDQAARSLEMKRFREGRTSLLVVTDVAARGIDLPVLEHVVNYDFTPSARVFVHRVGRTARAGKSGWAWSLITNKELPALCDLQLFLNRPLTPSPDLSTDDETSAQTQILDAHTSLHLGTLPREALDIENEYLTSTLPSTDANAAEQLTALKKVLLRAHKMYERSNGAGKPGAQSLKRVKKMLDRPEEGGEADVWKLAGSGKEESGIIDFYRRPTVYGLAGTGAAGNAVPMLNGNPTQTSRKHNPVAEQARSDLLAKISSFRPSETVFEIGHRGETTPLAKLMKDRRKTLEVNIERRKIAKAQELGASHSDVEVEDGEDQQSDAAPLEEQEAADEDDIKAVFDLTAGAEDASGKAKGGKKDYKDPDFYMGYQQKDSHDEKGYSLSSGSDFVSQARMASFGLTNDDGTRFGVTSQAPNAARWDVKKKKFVKGDGVGADNQKMIRTEAGTKLPASFKSGRFDEWKKKNRVDFAKVGEREEDNKSIKRFGNMGDGNKRFRHNATPEAKRLDPLARDYDAKMKSRQAKAAEGSRIGRDGRDASHRGPQSGRGGYASGGRGGRGGRGGGAAGGSGGRKGGAFTASRARNELKTSHQIAKERMAKDRRREKNARAPRKKKGGKR